MKNVKLLSALIFMLMSSNQIMSQTRTEKDLLGEKQIPGDAYYGVQTMRALENFTVSGMSTKFFPDYVRAFAVRSRVY